MEFPPKMSPTGSHGKALPGSFYLCATLVVFHWRLWSGLSWVGDYVFNSYCGDKRWTHNPWDTGDGLNLTGQTSNPAAPCPESGTWKNHPGFKGRLDQPCLPSAAPCRMHRLPSWAGSTLGQQCSSVNVSWSWSPKRTRSSVATKSHLHSLTQQLLGPLPAETPTLTHIAWPQWFSRTLAQATISPD